MNSGIRRIRPQLARLWPPPEGAIALTQLVTDSEYALSQVIEVVSADPELSARVLRLVAAEFPDPPAGAPWSVAAAADFLGKRSFTNLAIACWCSDYFARVDEGYLLPPGGMWRHALASGLAAQMLAAKANVEPAAAAFTAGVLHDIGKVALSPLLAAAARDLGAGALDGEDDFLRIERRLLRTDHAEAGAAVAKNWNLHPIFRSAIRNHHDPDRMVDDGALTSIAHLADIVASELGFGGGVDSLRYHADQTAPARLRLTESDIDRVKLDLLEETSRPMSLLRISFRPVVRAEARP